jgi:hypothetical protein
MNTIINILSIATIVAQIFVAISLIGWIFNLKCEKRFRFVTPRRLMFAFAVSLTATLGSLYLSEIAGLDPCKLCWFQRIFMYPQAVILLVAYWKRDELVGKYILPLSGIGILFSAYHVYIQQLSAPTMCSLNGPSCEVPEFVKYGYISIPVMALTAFAVLIALFTFYREKRD